MEFKRNVESSGISGWKSIVENLFVVILAFYPLRHVSWGLDLWDTGYNYANFTYMGTEHMDPMWLFSTYLSNAVGHLLTKLPKAGSLVGMNLYTGLFISALALLGYWFCTRRLRIQPWIAFLGEMIAVSMCWCPTALLYNYMTYVLFLAAVVLLYQGLVRERKGCLAAAGVCLGTNVLVRFSNLPEAAMILAVWAYDVILWLEGRRGTGEVGRKETAGGTGSGTAEWREAAGRETGVAEKRGKKTAGRVAAGTEGFWKRTLRHTGWCLLGYVSALVVLLGYIHVRYGIGEYVAGIGRLFAMTENATDYKAKSMIMSVVWTYVENLYWVVRIGIILAGGMILFAMLGWLEERLARQGKNASGLRRLVQALWIGVAGAMLVWLYFRRFCSFEFYTYGAMERPGILFLMLSMLIAVIRIFHWNSRKEEKLISGVVILVILLTSLGSNNYVFPSMNNLFVAAPYTLWECWKFFKAGKDKKVANVLISVFPVKCILAAFLAMCFFQFTVFGARFVFAEATGVQDISATVENNEILRNVKMSQEKARWMTELNEYVTENGLQGEEVILYGQIPSLSYYLQMPSAFNPWSDLDSYSYESMLLDMEELEEKTTVIIENRYVLYEEGGVEALEAAGVGEETRKKMQADKKWTLLVDFLSENGYEQVFRNEKFVIYR